eukprot:9192171-Alexandrium_andersonii.AAC.1
MLTTFPPGRVHWQLRTLRVQLFGRVHVAERSRLWLRKLCELRRRSVIPLAAPCPRTDTQARTRNE